VSNFVFLFHDNQNLFIPKLYGKFLCIVIKQKMVGLWVYHMVKTVILQ